MYLRNQRTYFRQQQQLAFNSQYACRIYLRRKRKILALRVETYYTGFPAQANVRRAALLWVELKFILRLSPFS